MKSENKPTSKKNYLGFNEDLCKDYDCDKYNCHSELFGDYCCEYVERQFIYFFNCYGPERDFMCICEEIKFCFAFLDLRQALYFDKKAFGLSVSLS